MEVQIIFEGCEPTFHPVTTGEIVLIRTQFLDWAFRPPPDWSGVALQAHLTVPDFPSALTLRGPQGAKESETESPIAAFANRVSNAFDPLTVAHSM
jgi:hypothetical protein